MAKLTHTMHRMDAVTVAGHGSGYASLFTWREVMGIEWAETHAELAEAVPPAYARYVASQFDISRKGVIA
jgi:hypothetical protein